MSLIKFARIAYTTNKSISVESYWNFQFFSSNIADTVALLCSKTTRTTRVGKIAIAPLISAIATTIANSDSGSGYQFSEK